MTAFVWFIIGSFLMAFLIAWGIRKGRWCDLEVDGE
jgi:hypothetical protein